MQTSIVKVNATIGQADVAFCLTKQKLRLGAVQKLFVQNAQDEFVSARRRREACRSTLTDDNAAMADSDKHNV